jgi:signal transduction histidine kinase
MFRKLSLPRSRTPEPADLLPDFPRIALGMLDLGGSLFAVIAVAHVLMLTGSARLIMVPVAAATSVFLFGVRAAFSLNLLRAAHLRYAAVLSLGVCWLNCALHLWLTGEAFQSTNLAILVIASAFVLLDWLEFAAVVGASFLAWGAAFSLASSAGPDQHWVHYGLHLFEAMGFAAAIQYWKMVTLVRNFNLRQEQAHLRNAEHQSLLAAQAKAIEAERNLRRALEADTAKSMFLANMSHELRTPLNSVVGFAELLRDRGTIASNPVLVAEYAACIHTSGEHLLGLINQILDFSRANAGVIKLTETDVDVCETVHEISRLLSPQAAEAGVELNVSCPTGPVILLADDLRLRQVVTNLLANAIKFTPKDGKVSASVRLEDGACVVEIRDTGIGIAACDQARVFAPFIQAEAGLAKAHQGTGLGLPISKKLIELHGGSISLKSALAEGTTVSVRFPASRTRLTTAVRSLSA